MTRRCLETVTSTRATRVPSRATRRTSVAVKLGVAALLLAGCAAAPGPVATDTDSSVSQPTTAEPSTGGPLVSGTSPFQIRPVTALELAGPDDCPPTPVDPPVDLPTRACDPEGPQQTVYELDFARVTLDDVAEAVVADSMGTPVVRITLTDQGAAQFSDMTAALAQNQLPANMAAIMLGGRVQSAPVVQQAIVSGAIEITGFTSTAEAQAVVDVLTAPAP